MSSRKTALLICDLQQKTVGRLFYKNTVLRNINKIQHVKQYIPQICHTSIS